MDTNERSHLDDANRQTDSLSTEAIETLPSELELVLLCLDYLRDLRRAYPPGLLEKIEGINSDYLTIACWALNRAIVAPVHLRHTEGNDAWFDSNKANITYKKLCEEFRPGKSLPDIEIMEKEVLYQENPADEPDENETEEGTGGAHSYSWYEYDDTHPSNSHRFYPLAGLASGPTLRGPLALGEITAAGLTSLGARSRLHAERDMIQSTLFEQFLEAVQAKGFFDDPQNEYALSEPEKDFKRQDRKRLVYEDRYRKVVAKFRTKLATKADTMTTGDFLAFSVADQQRRRREARIQSGGDAQSFHPADSPLPMHKKATLPPTPTSYLHRSDNLDGRLLLQEKSNTMKTDSFVDRDLACISQHNPIDIEQAEKLKNLGNTHMQKKEYKLAADYYTQALKLSPSGPNAHVYYSNRAAALVSMKKFQEAVLDSERSLALKPDYGKAHARLGLAHFLLGNYRQAMEAYTVALKYEPDNKSSNNYLEKAAKRLAESGDVPNITSSFSVVSEWERGKQQKASSNRSLARENGGKHQNEEYEKHRDETNDEREAEKYKVRGNSLMASRDYLQALDAYSKALELCPDGIQSHVYYSNRAAALCYLERYEDAEKDSLQSLALNPTYGKAHARLGLSRFFLHDYLGAVKAYTKALEHDPDNAASKSYLAKAMAKLESSGRRTPASHRKSSSDGNMIKAVMSPNI